MQVDGKLRNQPCSKTRSDLSQFVNDQGGLCSTSWRVQALLLELTPCNVIVALLFSVELESIEQENRDMPCEYVNNSSLSWTRYEFISSSGWRAPLSEGAHPTAGDLV
jgi:hypothetical protein